ncbi:hypothetical protein ALC56_06728 [Trachymyrmex septentrionalis]|uniref:Uncharacterized protein n=1 Tax=Trachymyrmex septentrionalis TaxID=34720 RepID=A0A195FFC9_9HYME|nr:hypothetical protein ALC56_06728 [Trachymyrmex septentrionalis]
MYKHTALKIESEDQPLCGKRTSYATMGILYDRVGCLWKVIIERASETERILDNHHRYGYPENPLTCADRRGSHRPPRVGPLSLLPPRGNLTSMPSPPLPRTLDLSVTNAYPPPSGIGNHFHEFIPDAGFEKPMSRGLLLAHLRNRVFRSFVCPSRRAVCCFHVCGSPMDSR